MSTSIVWFRRDLRLHDHEALHAATHNASCLPLFILPGEEVGAASKAWLHHSLVALQKDLRARGSDLLVMQGPPERAFAQLAEVFGPLHVHVQSSSDPLVYRTSEKARRYLFDDGHEWSEEGDAWLVPPPAVATQSGTPYKVFTPFWRALRPQIHMVASLPAPEQLPPLPQQILDLQSSQWGLQPGIAWDQHFWEHWVPGEKGAWDAWDAFLEGALHDYEQGRDRPDRIGTSRISPHLTWGEISVHALFRSLFEHRSSFLQGQGEKYLRELGWREFARHLFHAFPKLDHEDFAPSGLKWDAVDPFSRTAWQRGETGIPMVDAGMCELWQTGYMHNRVRMIVADFWCKHLGYDWRAGAAWFWDTLVDADLANNTLGWQWAGGTGPDAAPYYRIFNPVLQGQKFDPRGLYRHQFVPQLRALSGKALDLPGAAGGYVEPILTPAQGRARALAAWAARG